MFLAMSCCKKLVPPEVIVRDSVVNTTTVEKLRDTTIVIPADSSSIWAKLDVDSTNKILIKEIGGYQSGKDMIPPALSIKDNVLTVKSNVPERKLLLYYKERYVELLKAKSQTTTRTVTVNELYWYQKALMYTGIGAIILIILLIIKKFM